MKNVTKSRSTVSTYATNTSIAKHTQNILSFQRISHQRSPPHPEQSYIIMHSIANDPLTRSILIDSAARERGFLPQNYRIANTFDSIRQHRSRPKTFCKLPILPSSVPTRTTTRSDVFGNYTNSMSKLAEQRLILHEKIIRKKHTSTPIPYKQERVFHTLSDADFATDIPNALELIFRNTKRKSTMERYLLETLKRDRLQQARYRLLPINRAPFA